MLTSELFSVENWKLKGKLGQGGYGEVLHWSNCVTNVQVATKRLKSVNSLSADEQKKLFERWNMEYKWTREMVDEVHIVRGVHLDSKTDAKFVQYLNSNHVCQLPVIILEYCNGGDVRRQLQRDDNLNGLVEFEVRQILQALRIALDFLHSRQIYHRDLKPDNIVIHRMPDGRRNYKLTDFGFARQAPEKTIVQSVVGTHHYFAPEVIDSGRYNYKIDYWSMGIIAFEIGCGVLPFIPHQTLLNIISSIRKKPHDCIAIYEDLDTPNKFIFHNKLPSQQRMSNIWSEKMTQWLYSALDVDYKARGILNNMNLFSALDQMLESKILTAFVACSYQRLEFEVTPTMSISELGDLIVKYTGLPKASIYFVLPTGHPHKRFTSKTRPLDLYVDDWEDTSENANNPPVMLYIFSATYQCIYTAPEPHISQVIKHCLSSTLKTLPTWLIDRWILDMHFQLSKEQQHLKMFLLGLKEYAMSLEDDILRFRPFIDDLSTQKLKLCGAMDFFKDFVKFVSQLNTLNATEESDWSKISSKYDETIESIDNIITHFESALNTLREPINSTFYIDLISQDIFKVANFRKKFLGSSRNVQLVEFRHMQDISISYAEERKKFLSNIYVKHLRDSINNSHHRFGIISQGIQTAERNLTDISNNLKQLHQQIFKRATTELQYQQPTDVVRFEGFNSLQTSNLISNVLKTKNLLDKDME